MLLPDTQVFPWQQPGQLVELQVEVTQAPLWQTPVPQFMQTPPLMPHAVAVVAVTQVLPWQQPLGHVDGEQFGIWQVPLEQASPLPQVTHALPLMPQRA